MTPRQQRRLEQKLARKAAKRINEQKSSPVPNAQPTQSQERSDWCTPPISEAKLAANRANAQLSTGATTEMGKAIVAQNASKHGLTGKFRVLPGESQEDFDQLLTSFMHDEAPADQAEVEFVQQMAEALWLSNRSTRLQDQCLTSIQCGTPDEQRQAKKDLALYMRYQTTHERAFVRFTTELRKRRNERRKAERGFVSQKHREANENRKQELHEMRLAIQVCREERVQIQNRLAAAKAERLELENQAKKSDSSVAAAGIGAAFQPATAF